MSAEAAKRYRVKTGKRVHLEQIDPDETKLAGKKEAADENEKIQQRLADLQELLYAEHKNKILIVLQGMDTSGKDGTVRHVMAGFNPASPSDLRLRPSLSTERGPAYPSCYRWTSIRRDVKGLAAESGCL